MVVNPDTSEQTMRMECSGFEKFSSNYASARNPTVEID
jgi:hypothetical protein